MGYTRRGRHAHIESGGRKRGPMGPRRGGASPRSVKPVAVEAAEWKPDVYQQWCIRFLAEQNGATIGQLKRIFGVYRSDILNFVGELEAEEVVESKRFITEEDIWVSPTSYGMRLSETGYVGKPPHYRSLAHWSAINEARIYVEAEFRNVEWKSERRLRRERSTKKRGHLRGYLPDAVAICDGRSEKGNERRITCAVEVELSAKMNYDWHGHIAANEKKFDLIIYFATPEICDKFRALKIKQRHPKLKVVQIPSVYRKLDLDKWRLPGDPEPFNRETDEVSALEGPLTRRELRAIDLILEQGAMPMDQFEVFLEIGPVEASRLADRLVQTRALDRAKPLDYEPPWLWATPRGAKASSTGLKAFVPSLGGLERARAMNQIRYRYTHGKKDVEWISYRTLTQQSSARKRPPGGAIKRRRKVKTKKGIVVRTELQACDLYLFIASRKQLQQRTARRFGEGYDTQLLFYSNKSGSQIKKFVRELSVKVQKKVLELPMPTGDYLLMSPRPRRKPGPKSRSPRKKGLRPSDIWATLASRPPVTLRRMVVDAIEQEALEGIALAAEIEGPPKVLEAWTQLKSRGMRVCWLVTDVGFFRVGHGGWGTIVDEVMREDVFVKEDGPPIDPRKKKRKVHGKQRRPEKFEMSDEVWKAVAPNIPRYKPKGRRSKRPITERAVLSGVIWRLRNDVGWQDIPTELGYGNGSVICSRVREWEEMGYWDKIWMTLRDELPDGRELEWWRTESDKRRRRPDAPPPVRLKPRKPQGPRKRYVREAEEPERFEMSDEVWEQLEAVLKGVEDQRVKPLGYWISDRAAISGILWRLREKATWKDVKVSLGYGNSEIVRTRLREFEALGVWDEMREILESQLDDGYELQWWSLEPEKGLQKPRKEAGETDSGNDRRKQQRGYRPPLPKAVPLVEKFNSRERALLRMLQEDPEYRFTFADYRRTMGVKRQGAKNDIGHLTEEWLLIGTRVGKTFTFGAPKDLGARLKRLEEAEVNSE
jgi:transposase